MEPFDADRAGSNPNGADMTGAARLDRLRRRVGTQPRPPGRQIAPWIITALLLAFALGLIANPWFERSVRSHLPGFAPTLAPTVGDVAALQARVAVLEARVAHAPAPVAGVGSSAGDNERLARLEGRLESLAAAQAPAAARTDTIATGLATLTGRIDATSVATAAALTTATNNAERAQSMLVLAATRRAIDGGERLGGLEPALRRQFSARAPQLVEDVAALGAAPITLAGLRGGFERLRSTLTGASVTPDGPRGWWQGLTDSLAGIVVRAAPTANDTKARVDRAGRALAVGNVAAAMAEVAALPAAARSPAQPWLAAAQRYVSGQRGLAQLEAAMLEPLPAAPLLPGPILPAPMAQILPGAGPPA